MVLNLIVSLPPQMARYLKDVFGARVAPLMGMTADELYEMKCSMSPEELAEALTPRVRPLTMEVDAFIRQLDEMNVEQAVIFNQDEETPSGLKGLPNDYYADLVRRYPDRFIGIAGIDPLKGMDAVREIRRCHELGLRGVAVRPFMFGIPPTMPRCTRFTAPVWSSTSPSGFICPSIIRP